jgi:hypothetical protein
VASVQLAQNGLHEVVAGACMEWTMWTGMDVMDGLIAKQAKIPDDDDLFDVSP